MKPINKYRLFLIGIIFTLAMSLGAYAEDVVIELPVTVNLQNSEAAAFINYANSIRVQEGQSKFIPDSVLMKVARQRCADLAVFYEHTSAGYWPNSGRGVAYKKVTGKAMDISNGCYESLLVGVQNASGVYKLWREDYGTSHNWALVSDTRLYCGCASALYNGTVYWVWITTEKPCGSACTPSTQNGNWSTTTPIKTDYLKAEIYDSQIYYGVNNNRAEIRLQNLGDDMHICPGYTIPANMLRVESSNPNVVTYSNGKLIPHNVGTATLTVYVNGYKTKETTPVTVRVLPQDQNVGLYLEGDVHVNYKINVSTDSLYNTYTGYPIKPKIKVVNWFGTTLTEGKDYKVVYSDNINPTYNAWATVYGLGNYDDGSGSHALGFVKFYIVEDTPANALCSITIDEDVYYNSLPQKPSITVCDFNGKIVPPSEYTVTYSNNVEVGTGTVIVKGKGSYTGTIEGTFTIQPAKARKFSKISLSKSVFVYSGKAQKPSVKVYVGNKEISSAYYSVKFKNNVKVGIPTVTVKGKGIYTGYSLSQNYYIVAKAPANIAYKYNAKTKTLTLKSSKTNYVNGYIFQVSNKSNFSSYYKKNYKVSGNNYALSKLNRGTYYVRVRGYTKVGSKKIYTGWRTKKIKVR